MAITFALILLMLLICGAVVAGLLGWAIASRRFAVAAGIGSAALLLLIVVVGGVWSYTGVRREVYVPTAVEVPLDSARVPQQLQLLGNPVDGTAVWQDPAGPHVQYAPTHEVQVVSSRQPIWFLGFRVLIGALLVAFIVSRLMRRSTPEGAKRRKWWPLALPLVFILLFFSVRTVSYKTNRVTDSAISKLNQQVNNLASTVRTNVDRERQRVEGATHTLEHSAALQVSRQREKSAAARRIAQADIHELMDQFDAPRIVLPPVGGMTGVVMPFVFVPLEEIKNETARDSASAAVSSELPRPAVAGAQSRRDQPAGSPGVAASSKKEEPKADPDTESQARGDVASVRPAWVEEQPKRTGNARREVVATEEYESVDECYLAADIYLLLKTYQHIQQLAGRPYFDPGLPSLAFANNGGITANGTLIAISQNGLFWHDPRLRALHDMGIGVDYVRRELVAKDLKNNEPREYLETVDRSFGPMRKLYLQIEFTPAVDRELRQFWEAHARQERFAMAGVGAASILGLLGVVFGLLKIDTATKGYYTKRLFIGVPATLVCVIAMFVAIADAPMSDVAKAAVIACISGLIAAIFAIPRRWWS